MTQPLFGLAVHLVALLTIGGNPGTTVQRKSHGPGKDGAEVVLLVIQGGGHTWPGRDSLLPILGKSTGNISANDLMWEFFQKHPMK
jgi:polyhydroxybutyrate depolymerase